MVLTHKASFFSFSFYPPKKEETEYQSEKEKKDCGFQVEKPNGKLRERYQREREREREDCGVGG